MPLDPTLLSQRILTLTNPVDPSFVGFPADTVGAAANWAAVASVYLGGLVVPPGAVAALVPATSAFSVAMASTLGPAPSTLAIPALVAGFSAAVGVLAAASVPPAVPPLGPALSGLLTSALTPFAAGTLDPVGPADALASAIDTWVRQGTWIPPGSPVPVLWS